MSRPKGKQTKTIDSLWIAKENELKAAGYTYEKFKNNMISLSKTHTTPKGKPSISKAWDAFAHKEDFVSKEVRGAENLLSGLKEQGDFATVRKDVFGWRNKQSDYVKYIKWNKDTNMYEYMDKSGKVWTFELITGNHGSQYWRWS